MNQQPTSKNRIVFRNELIEKLDNSRHGRITWLNANAGAGKSTLINSYVQHADIPHLWYQITPEDSNVANIFAQISNLLRHSIDQDIFTPTYQPDLHLDLAAFCAVFFKRLFAAAPKDFYLVFEDFHLSKNTSELPYILIEALQYLLPGQHILITSREAPPPDLMPTLAKSDATIINNNELKFTLQEVEELLVSYNLTQLTLNEIKKLRDNTDGWISGLVLIINNYSEHGELVTHFDRGQNTHLFQYFTGLIFSSLSASEQQFLLHLSIAPFFTHDLVELLDNSNDGWELIETLIRKNFFVSPVRSPENAIKLHDLLREYLLKRALDTLPGTLVTDLRLTIADYLSDISYLDEAIELYSQCDSFDKIESLILHNGFEKCKQGQSRSVDRWLSLLPEVTIKDNAQLCLLKGCTLGVLNPSQALEHLERAFRISLKGDNHLLIAQCWSNYINFLAVERLDTRTFMEELSKLEQYFNGTLHHPDAQTRFYLLDGVVTVKAYTGYLDPRVDKYIDIAEQYVYETKEINHTAHMFRSLFIAFAFYGDHRRAIRLDRYLASEQIRSEMTPYTLFMLALNVIEETHFYPNPQVAGNWLNTLRDLRNEHAWTNCSIQLESAEAYQALLSNNPDQAEKLIEAFSHKASMSHPIAEIANIFMRGWLASLRGDYDDAMRKSRYALSLIGNSGVAHGQVQIHLLNGFSAASTNRKDEYRNSLDTLIKWNFSDSVCKAETLHLQSYWYLMQKDRESAKAYLEQALSIAANLEVNTIGGLDHNIRAKLLAFALEEEIEAEYAKTIINSLDLDPPENCSEKAWPWKIRMYTQGSLSILVNEIPLEFDRSPQKTLEFIKSLIVYGGKDVSLTKLADTLWPELDGSKSNNNIHVAIRRARDLLGDDVILVSNKKASLNPKKCWVDKLAIRKFLEDSEKLRAKASPEYEDIQKVITTNLQICSLYEDHLFANEDLHYSLREPIETFHRRVLKSLISSADWLFSHDFVLEARNLFEECLLRNPEDTYIHKRMEACIETLA